MIGEYIKGIDHTTGKPVEGFILDKVRSIINLQMKGQGIGQMQQMPVPVDVYLVLSPDGSLHEVPPALIRSVDIKLQPAVEEGPSNGLAEALSGKWNG